MVRLFNIENNKVIPTEHCYLIQGLKDIMEEYPDQYLNIYAYLFYMNCYDEELNPFTNVPEVEKEDLILQEVGGDFSIDDELIDKAFQLVKKLYQTPIQQMYVSNKIAIEKVSRYLSTTVLSDGRDGNTSNYIKFMEKFDILARSFEGRYKAYRDELDAAKGRGGINLAYDEDDV